MDWIYRTMSRILGSDKSDAAVDRIISMKNEAEFDEYLKTILNLKNPQHQQFYNALKKQFFGDISKKKKDDKNVTQLSKKNKKKDKQKSQSQEDKDREKCGCNAKWHKYYQNCTKCGLVLCEEEGAGPCFFCGEIIDRDNQTTFESGISKKSKMAYMNAIELRDRLIQYDNSPQMRHVIDDQHMFFEMNSTWLMPEEREYMEKAFQEMVDVCDKSKENLLYTFDLQLRKFIREKPKVTRRQIEYDTNECKLNPDVLHNAIVSNQKYYEYITESLSQMDIQETGNKLLTDDDISKHEEFHDSLIIKEIDEVYCNDVALAVKQPWASFIITGLKCHLSWLSPLKIRGRVWLVSLPSDLSKKQIQHEEQYLIKNIDTDLENVKPPTEYPINSILGQVEIIDCLDFEEYKYKYPFDLEEGDNVLIIGSPKQLNKPFRIKGIRDICMYFFFKRIIMTIFKSI